LLIKTEEVNFCETEISFLFDFLKQAIVWKVEIRFESFVIEGGLSEKAMKLKFDKFQY